RTRPRATVGVGRIGGRRRASPGSRLGLPAHGGSGGVRAGCGPRKAGQGRVRGWQWLVAEGMHRPHTAETPASWALLITSIAALGHVGKLLLGEGHPAVIERDQVPRHPCLPCLPAASSGRLSPLLRTPRSGSDTLPTAFSRRASCR